jgi:hypothetical protein
MAAVLAGAAWATEEVQLPQATGPTVAQAAPAPAPAQASKPSVSTKEPIRPTQVRTAPPPRAEAKPTWAELTVQQQASLAPLATTWGTLGEAHKRKWLALSENFHSMPQPEQARLHSRMTEWAVLSPQQRTTARLNFVEAQKVAPVDKRAKWEAYQALPPEEKKRLAAGAAAAKPPPPPTALAVRPVPKEKLARIPARGKKSEPAAKLAVVPPTPAEGNGLLPAPAASSQP